MATAETASRPVILIPRSDADLALLQERTGLSGTDLINRAVQLYEFIDAQMATGTEILLRSPDGMCSVLHLG